MARGRRERRRPRRGWTREAVRDALGSWAREEGRAPRADEWAPWAAAALGVRAAQTLKWGRERGRWPSLDVAGGGGGGGGAGVAKGGGPPPSPPGGGGAGG